MQAMKRQRGYRVLPMFLLIVFNVFGESDECGENFVNVLQGIVSFNSEPYPVNDNFECVWNITGPIETYVQVYLRGTTVSIGQGSILEISDGAFGEILQLSSDWPESGPSSMYVNSLANNLLIIFNGIKNNNNNTSFSIPFDVLFESNSTTMYTDPSGIIASNGSANTPVINYVHTHQIDVDYLYDRVYLFLDGLTLDDAFGDFISIGSGDDVFNGPPAILLSGKWSGFSPIEVESGTAYLHVYARNYTCGLGFSFFYNSSVFLPPTDEPPTTAPPPIPLNVTINYDFAKDDINTIVTRFVSAMSSAAVKYCRGDFQKNGTISHLTSVDLFVVEAVYSDPCVVFVFYVVLHENNTCLDHRPFTGDDFYYMMSNYSSKIEKEFGRPILQSCDVDVSVWVVFVAIIVCFSLTLTVVVVMTRRNDTYKKLAKIEVTSSDFKENPIFGVKVDNEENAYVMWSQSERPSVATIKPPTNAGRRHSHCSNSGFFNEGFVDDESTVANKREVTFMTDLPIVVDDGAKDDVLNRLAQTEIIADGFSLDSKTETHPGTLSTELTSNICDELEDALEATEEKMNETKL